MKFQLFIVASGLLASNINAMEGVDYSTSRFFQKAFDEHKTNRRAEVASKSYLEKAKVEGGFESDEILFKNKFNEIIQHMAEDNGVTHCYNLNNKSKEHEEACEKAKRTLEVLAAACMSQAITHEVLKNALSKVLSASELYYIETGKDFSAE